MDLHLRGKRVLITGASKGIGAAAAEAFAEEGAHLMLAARNGEQLKALTERLRSTHQIAATAHVVDLRKGEDIARLVKELGVQELVTVDSPEYGAGRPVADVPAATALLQAEVAPGDVVLVKASRAAGLDRIAAELLGGNA